MNCSTNFDLFDENVSDLISVSANVAFTFTTALIFYLSVRNFGGTFYRLRFKLDNFVSIVIILNGVVAIFSALEATLSFLERLCCQRRDLLQWRRDFADVLRRLCLQMSLEAPLPHKRLFRRDVLLHRRAVSSLRTF